MSLTHLSRAAYERSRAHGYAGPLSTLHGPTRLRWEALGATGWQLANEGGATVLRPVRVADPVECGTCHYPHEADACPNPACPANPSLSDEHREAIYRRHAEHVDAEAERAERMRLWGRSFGA